jgi:hypothetical protein
MRFPINLLSRASSIFINKKQKAKVEAEVVNLEPNCIRPQATNYELPKLERFSNKTKLSNWCNPKNFIVFIEETFK